MLEQLRGATVLVTGASGYIGGWICESSHLRGLKVRAGIRRWNGAARLARFPEIETVMCDIMDPASLREAMRGVDYVIHCAYTDATDVITRGTEFVLEAAKAAGVKHLVHMSSAEVYGTQSGELAERDAEGAADSDYGRAKAAAEAACRRLNGDGFGVTVLRPSIVYGPFSTEWVGRTAQRLASGQWGVFEGLADGQCNLIYVDDLALAALHCLATPAAAGQVFNVNNTERLTWNGYFEALNTALGLPVLRRISNDETAARSARMGRVRGMADVVLSRYKPQIMKIYLENRTVRTVLKRIKTNIGNTPSSAELGRLYGRQAYYRPDALQAVTGFTPQMRVARGLEISAAWVRQAEVVPS
jgi:nucleoside-diphosphate-sugar epimerase